MHMPMVMAAAISPAASAAIENHIQRSGKRLESMIARYLEWLRGPYGRRAPPSLAQRRFTALRLQFSAILAQFDIFAEAVTQRGEHDYGVWLAGLDILAEDALRIPDHHISSPPMICYLDRGIGAAIRRFDTRLPGGSKSPVSIIRVPRERMIGDSVSASIVHEVAHQRAALTGLNESLKREFQKQSSVGSSTAAGWRIFKRWASEIIADFWSVGKVCITGTLGIMTVVSLPRSMVLHHNVSGVHPTPWLRVKLSCAMGDELYPHSQWEEIARVWEELYPLSGISPQLKRQFRILDDMVPEVAGVIAEHQSPGLNGESLREIMPVDERQPIQLRRRFKLWQTQPNLLNTDPPTLAFAVLGQAKTDGQISPEEASKLLNSALKQWALHRAVSTGISCAKTLSAQTKQTRNLTYKLT
jgi:hypothetical protein